MKWDQLLSTWFGAGKLKPAPGTWGSLAALPPGLLLLWWQGWPALAAGVIIVTALGIWASGAYTRRLSKDDPGEVVIDEVAGQWVAILPLSFDWRLFALAFIAFRFFDIIKPWPVGWLDRHLSGGLGIMADDLAAGILAGASVALAGWLIWGVPCFP